MTDDYSYSQTQLKKKAEGPFGLSGDSKFGLGSRSTSNPDQPGRGSQTPPQDQGGGEAEQEGGTGGGGGLPAGSSGSLLRHNGSAWVTITPPSGKESVVVNSTGSAGNYIQGNTSGGIIYFNGSTWEYLDGSTFGERALILRNGQPEWLGTPAIGTHVLGSVGGEIQWIETEECEE